jgi:long-chain acyl-CoA synthetase
MPADKGVEMMMPVETLCDLFYYVVESHRKTDHLRYKRAGTWRSISSDEFRAAVEEVSMGLQALGLGPSERVAILSENRPEWVFADMGALIAGAVDVPIYPTLPPDQALYILAESEARAVVVSTPAQARKVSEVRGRAPQLQHVIGMDPEIPGVLSFDELRAKGREALSRDPGAARRSAAQSSPENVATIIYTSGTTGDPKGAMLTHRNILSNVDAGLKVFDFNTSDVVLSFLPLSHSFERTAGYYLMLKAGCTIAYAESVEKVPANMAEVAPTVMCAVPRLYEKIYSRINEKVAGDPPLRRAIFRWAIGVGRRAFQHVIDRTTAPPTLRLQRALAEKLVFSKIRARVGGRLRLFVSGGAPLAKEIAEFFGSAGFYILEGYGLTETSPIISVNRPREIKPGSVGLPLDGVEVRIADDGEILVKGPNVMQGYFKKPADTAELIDSSGWLHTGDIGLIDDRGFITITDRKKDIIVTSGGKNVAPQPIENRLRTSPLIAEVVVIGNKRKYPAALIVPAFEALEKWAAARGIQASGRADLVARPEVLAHYERIVRDLTSNLAEFEKVRRIAVLESEFTIDTGELTPKLSVKRRVVEEKYRTLIDRTYGKNSPPV